MRAFLFLLCAAVHSMIAAQTGVSWSQTRDVAPSAFSNMHPRMVTDRVGNPLIIWGSANAKKAFFSRWAGNSFTAPVQLNPESIPIFAASWAGPDLAAHGDTVYVVFKETPEDDSGVYLVRSFDGGANFSGLERVDAIADSISRFPSVGTDKLGNPLVAFMKFNPGWSNARYVLAKSNDYGNTFNIDILGSGFSGGTVCDCCPSTLVSSDDAVALMYRDNLNNLRNSWAGVSLDGGNSFAGGIEIDNTDWLISACPSSGPDGTILGDKLYSVFMSAASGKTLCYHSRSSLSSLQFDTIAPITGNFTGLGQQNFPRIASSGNAAAIVWQQTVNGSSQLAVLFTDQISNGFPTPYEVLVANNVTNADVALSPGKIHVVWEDKNGMVRYKSGIYTVSDVPERKSEAEIMRIYPNPATRDGIVCHFDRANDIEANYVVSNLQGQTLLSGTGYITGGRMTIDNYPLQPGVYFVRTWLNGAVHIRPVIVG